MGMDLKNKNKSLNEEIKNSVERYLKFTCNNKKNFEIVVITPFIENYDFEKFICDLEGASQNKNNKMILLFSIFEKDSPEFDEFFEEWLFVINHYATVIKIPFNAQELKNIKQKNFLKIEEIKSIYDKLKESMEKEEKNE